MGERIRAAFVPFIVVIEVLMCAVTDYFRYRPRIQKCRLGFKDMDQLAKETRCNFFVPSNYSILLLKGLKIC